MSKGGKTTTQTTAPDALTQSAREDVFRRGQGVLDDPRFADLLDSFGAAGQRGIDAIASGDFSSFLNPFQQQVIDRVNSQFGKQADLASNFVDERATRAGAFGGSRAEIARGQAVGDVANRQADVIAQLLHGGFNEATSRANDAATLGLGGFQRLADMPGSLFDFVGQFGGQTNRTKQPGGSLLGGLLGLGTTAAGLFSGAGASPGAAALNFVGAPGTSFGGVQPAPFLANSQPFSPLQLR